MDYYLLSISSFDSPTYYKIVDEETYNWIMSPLEVGEDWEQKEWDKIPSKIKDYIKNEYGEAKIPITIEDYQKEKENWRIIMSPCLLSDEIIEDPKKLMALMEKNGISPKSLKETLYATDC